MAGDDRFRPSATGNGSHDEMKRGLGSDIVSSEERKRIASIGGKSCPPEKRAFYTNPGLAVIAGRKGGKACQKNLREANERVGEKDHCRSSDAVPGALPSGLLR